MAFELEFNVVGEEQLQRSFSRFGEDVEDASEAFREIAKDFREKLMPAQFNTQGSHGGSGWPPLSPNYAAWKAKNYPGAPILVRSGLLRESLEKNNAYSIVDIQPKSMNIGSRVNYAIFHQQGTRKLPQRKIIQLSEEDKTRWTKIVHVWLLNRANKEFAGIAQVESAASAHISNI